MDGFGQFAATVLLMILFFGSLFLLFLAFVYAGGKFTNRRGRSTQDHGRH